MCKQRIIECGCCGHYHRVEYYGDCRKDSERFNWDQLDERFPEGWVEVDTDGEELN